MVLRGDAFAPSLGLEDFGVGATSALLAGLSSGAPWTPYGFESALRPRLGAANVERLSDVRARLTLYSSSYGVYDVPGLPGLPWHVAHRATASH